MNDKQVQRYTVDPGSFTPIPLHDDISDTILVVSVVLASDYDVALTKLRVAVDLLSDCRDVLAAIYGITPREIALHERIVETLEDITLPAPSPESGGE